MRCNIASYLYEEALIHDFGEPWRMAVLMRRCMSSAALMLSR